ARWGGVVPGHDHDSFEHSSDEGRGQPAIAPSAMLFEGEQSRLVEPRKMAAHRLRGYAGHIGEFGCSQAPAIHQSREHMGTRRIAHQGGELSKLRCCVHSSFYTQWCDERRTILRPAP